VRYVLEGSGSAWERTRPGPHARDLLTPRLRLVHEGFDTADPKSAEAFVRELT
jgi:hypothetical protein